MNDVHVHGTVEPGFESVREVFAGIAADEARDGGAQLAVHHRSRLVVDLWGGDGVDGDSLLALYSCSKGATALVVALLVQDGALDLDRTVASWWPEFAAGGRGDHPAPAPRPPLRGDRRGRRPLPGGAGRRPQDRRPPRRPASLLGAGHRARLPRPHLRRPGRRGGPAGHRPDGPGAVRGAGPRSVRPRLPPGPARGARTPLPHGPAAGPHPGQRALLAEHPVAPDSLLAVAFDLHADPPFDDVAYANSRAVRARAPLLGGGVGSARGLSRMYAAIAGELDGRPRSWPPAPWPSSPGSTRRAPTSSRARRTPSGSGSSRSPPATRRWARARSATAAPPAPRPSRTRPPASPTPTPAGASPSWRARARRRTTAWSRRWWRRRRRPPEGARGRRGAGSFRRRAPAVRRTAAEGGRARAASGPGDQAAFLIAEMSKFSLTLSLTMTPPVSRAAFQVRPTRSAGSRRSPRSRRARCRRRPSRCR